MSYGPGTDPTPYIAGAYALGALVVVGFFLWVIIERKSLRRSLAILKAPDQTQQNRGASK